MNKFTCFLALSFIFTVSNFAIGQRNTTTVKRPVFGTDSARTNSMVPATPPREDNPTTSVPIPPGTAQQAPPAPSDTTNPVLTSITGYVKKIVDFAFPYALVASLVGALSMALLQTLKDIMPIRSWSQKAMLKKWYEDKQGKMEGIFPPDGYEQLMTFLNKEKFVAADLLSNNFAAFVNKGDKIRLSSFEGFETQLISLSTDGNKPAFYDLPIEQLAGQLNICAQLAIEYPTRYVNILTPLVASADPLDIYILFFISPPSPAIDNPDSKAINTLYAEARNRVAHQIQRAVDAIQISFGARWKKDLQIASIVLSGIICALGVGFLDTQMTMFQRLALALISAVLGGFLAPVARDLVAALQKLRS